MPVPAFNTALRDPTLSLKAKGLLAMMLNRPHMTLEQVRFDSRDGKAAIQTAARELVHAGILDRQLIRDAQGRLTGTTYILKVGA